MHWVAAMGMADESRVKKQLNILHNKVASECRLQQFVQKQLKMTSNGGGDYLGVYDILEKKKVCPYMIKPKCVHWIPALYCLSHFLIGLCLFHFQTIIGAVLLQGIELAQRLMADTLCSLGLYKSDLLPPRSRNRWVGIRLPAWSTTVQESDSGVVVCCLTCRLQESKPSSIREGKTKHCMANETWSH